VITNRILQGEYGAPQFSAKDIANLEWFANKLKGPAPEDGVSKYLAAQLTPATMNLLSNYTGNVDATLQQALAADLNRVIQSGPLYEAQRFTNVTLTAKTMRLLARKPQGLDLVRLNRKLLLEVYPLEMSRTHWREAAAAGLVLLAGLVVAKLVATLATVGSGAVGGVFTPTLFLGAGLGATFALSLQQLGAGEDLPIAAFAVVGMGSMLAATTRSPLLAMIMVFEISLDYSLMPPLMLACVVSILVGAPAASRINLHGAAAAQGVDRTSGGHGVGSRSRANGWGSYAGAGGPGARDGDAAGDRGPVPDRGEQLPAGGGCEEPVGGPGGVAGFEGIPGGQRRSSEG